MENVATLAHIESDLGLTLIISDLKQAVHYEDMRIRIDDNDWIYLARGENNDNKSTKAVFTNLDSSRLYQSYGEVKIDGSWINVHSPKLQPQKIEIAKNARSVLANNTPYLSGLKNNTSVRCRLPIRVKVNV